MSNPQGSSAYYLGHRQKTGTQGGSGGPQQTRYIPQQQPVPVQGLTFKGPRQHVQPNNAAAIQAHDAQGTNIHNTDILIDHIAAAIIPHIQSYQQSNVTRMSGIEFSIRELSSQLNNNSRENDERLKKLDSAITDLQTQLTTLYTPLENKALLILETVDVARKVQVAAFEGLATALKRLENMIGKTRDLDQSKSMMERLDEITFIVGDLLERTSDPDANGVPDTEGSSSICEPKSTVVAIGERTNVGRTFANAAIDTMTPEPSTPRKFVSMQVSTLKAQSPIRLSFGTSPIASAYTDIATDARNLSPPRRMASDIPRSFIEENEPDATILAENISTKTARESAATAAAASLSPKQVYPETGTGPVREESPGEHMDKSVPPSLSLLSGESVPVDASSSTSPRQGSVKADSSRQQSVDEPTLTEDINKPVLSKLDVWEKIVSKMSFLPEDLDIDEPSLEYVDDPHTFVAVDHQGLESAPIVETSESKSPSLGEPSKSFSPAKWSTIDMQASVARPPMSIFHPDNSPETTKKFSLLRNQTASPDGTVASLRRDVFGDSHAGPVTSTPVRPVSPFHSRPSVSPLPSPAPTRYSSPENEPQDLPSARNPTCPASDIALSQEAIDQPETEIHQSKEQNNLVNELADLQRAPSPAVGSISTTEEEEHVSQMVIRPSSQPDMNRRSRSPTIRSSYSPNQKGSSPLSEVSVSPPPTSGVQHSFPVTDNLRRSDELLSPSLSKLNPKARHVVLNASSARSSSASASKVHGSVVKTPSLIYVSSREPSPIPDTTKSISTLSALTQFSDDDTPIIPAKKPKKDVKDKPDAEKDQKLKHLDLRSMVQKDKNAAATRIKKRKDRAQTVTGDEEEPPLKRVKQRANNTVAKKVSPAKKMKIEQPSTPRKRKVLATITPSDKRRGRPKQKPVWPEIKTDTEGFYRKFIKCDRCSMWYHYGCTGIDPGDERIQKESVKFICPPCEVNREHNHKYSAGTSKEAAVCAREDCGHPTASPDLYFVSGIVGRRAKTSNGHGKSYMWLIRWDGYPITSATWESESSMSDPQNLIEEFREAARKEGINPDLDPRPTILLREALAGGWLMDSD